jgi:hypothetical protein
MTCTRVIEAAMRAKHRQSQPLPLAREAQLLLLATCPQATVCGLLALLVLAPAG